MSGWPCSRQKGDIYISCRCAHPLCFIKTFSHTTWFSVGFFCLHKIGQLTLIDSQRHQNVKVSFVIRVAGNECAFSCPSQSHFYARCTSEASVISPGCCLRAACTILCFVYSCVYLPILILAITRMAGHVKRRFAHSQWMDQYWQHTHRISDQCKGLPCSRFTGFQLNSMRRVAC